MREMTKMREMTDVKRRFESLLMQRKVQKEVNRNRSGGKRGARRRKRVVSGFFHVYVRGYQSRLVFLKDDDRIMFLIITNEVFKETGSSLLGYILLDNHFHFLCKTENITRLMGQIMFRYTMWYKRQYPLIKSVFDTPFGSAPLYKSSLIKETFLYLLSNAKRANMCRVHEEYFWSSANQYFSGGRHLLDKYIEVDASYALSNYSSAYTLNKEVNEFKPIFKDGKVPLRKRTPDDKVYSYFITMLKGRIIKDIGHEEVDIIIKSLRFNCHATYSQIKYLVPRSFENIRKVCKT